MRKPEWLSTPGEQLVEECARGTPFYDVVIVGSGYGGALAAERLAGAEDVRTGRPLTVCILERGRERVPGTFPNSFSELPGEVRFSRFDDPLAKGAAEGLFDLRIGKDVSVLVANGLGGGSLVNAGVAAIPPLDVFASGWPTPIREEFSDKGAVNERYRRASASLGVELAEVGPRQSQGRIEKHYAFTALTRELHPQRAEITVDQERCLRCGDCATGCNVGAKKTLASTHLARARGRGARIYTGLTVSHLERDGDAWTVRLSLTEPTRPLESEPLRSVRAGTVILAAGALGSTEILLRSQAQSSTLRFSARLGKRFSTNGDMISALCADPGTVNAAAKESQPLERRNVGPTITGIAMHGSTRAERVVVEELAIPGALRRVFGEVVTTAAMLASLARRDDEEHPRFSTHDPAREPRSPAPREGREPLAVDEDALDACQIFASMGDDGAEGRLELVPGWKDLPSRERARNGALRVHWPQAGKQRIYRLQDRLLESLAKQRGATYLRNPLWQPIPREVSDFFSGAKPTGLLFSVHPLGGCAMADNVADGVVDHMGRVFDPHGKDVHPGLLVLDGAIVPTALGINPMLTISVLAERALELYARDRWRRSEAPPAQIGPAPHVERRVAEEAVTRLRFSERASGELQLAPGAAPLEARLDFHFDEVANLRAWLTDRQHPMHGTGVLSLRESPMAPFEPACEVAGDVEFLVRGASSACQRIRRALGTYLRTRAFADAWDYFFGKRNAAGDADDKPAQGLLSIVRGYVTLASRVGEIRYLFYDLRCGKALHPRGAPLAGTRLLGRKTLRYVTDGNPWRQLTDLELTAHPKHGKPFRMGVLAVDLGHFFKDFETRLRISGQRDLPASWLDLASAALFFARVLVKCHFWSFRLPEYQEYDPMRDVRRLPGKLPGLRMERELVGYPAPPREPGVFLPLTRYRDGRRCSRGPVLLVHGLGASGNLFATTRVSPNLVQHLAAQGFDVWVAELRTSIALPYSADQWTIDEVARGDLPRIVDTVLEKTGARQLDVVAHCIGSAMLCTAVLDGRLQHGPAESKIRRAALLQVGPLVTLSRGSRLRALAVAPLRRLLPAGHLDFSVDERAGWLESLIDRVLNTYPYPPEEARHHRPGLGGRHARHIANCNRWAAIDGRMILHRNLSPAMLDGLGEVLGHASITTWEQTIQYALLERLTDFHGGNAYVTAENIRRYFTFPVRFLHGAENDVFDPLTAWRSQELLRRVHGPEFPAEIALLPNYSHIDPLIGKAAAADVYPSISSFLSQPLQPWAPMRQPQPPLYLRRPLVGPLLGWLRRVPEGWRLRVWCRLDDRRSPVSFALVQVCAGGERHPARRVGFGEASDDEGRLSALLAGPMDTVLCADVDLPDAPADYEISVRSAHEALEGKMEEGHRAAEARAGRPVSQPSPLPAEQIEALAGPQPPRLSALAPASPGAEDDKIGEARLTLPLAEDTATFYVASCRYPGWLVDRGMADAAFVRLAGRLRGREAQAAALFLVGDQIYADATAGVFDPKDARERFYDAYREAWSAPGAREVLSRVPTYMMMDDHEAGNDWHPQDAASAEDVLMREEGIKAFERYQWLHSPGKRRRGARERELAYHYSFDLPGLPVFVCDTRTGRGGRRFILDAGQFEKLVGWLRRQPRESPKLVVSPSVVVPFLEASGPAACAARSDGWDGFLGPLQELFSVIARETDNVIFLCGDPHFSMSSEIWFERGGERTGGTCYCIVASPLYAPYPFANASAADFLADNASRPIALPDELRLRYRVIPASVVAGDGFTEVVVRSGEPPVVNVYGAEERSFELRAGCSTEMPATRAPAREIAVP